MPDQGVSFPPIDLVAIPTPATATPPGVSDSGALGTNTTQYALANHTHASRVRKQRVVGISSSVVYSWTFSSPFPAGTVPIINAIVEDPTNSSIDTYNVQVVGTPTATGCQLRVTRITSGLFGLLTGALGFNTTSSTVNLHCIALEP